MSRSSKSNRVKIEHLINHVQDEPTTAEPSTPKHKLSIHSAKIDSSRQIKKLKPHHGDIVPTAINTTGKIRYPVYTDLDEVLAAHHQTFDVFPPVDQIEHRFVQRIPYTSAKKDFSTKTGRGTLEVFQYRFTVLDQQGELAKFFVRWDYNIGLVRMTDIFKSMNGSTKTTPAKVLNLNPGLKEISYSITGGNIAAQGYWIPFEAAKAIAASSCYEIRYALTPIFGPEFPDQCIAPNEHSYRHMVISRDTIARCVMDAQAHRSSDGLVLSDPSSPPTINGSSPTPTKSYSRANREYVSSCDTPASSSNYSDSDHDRYITSPTSSTRIYGHTRLHHRRTNDFLDVNNQEIPRSILRSPIDTHHLQALSATHPTSDIGRGRLDFSDYSLSPHERDSRGKQRRRKISAVSPKTIRPRLALGSPIKVDIRVDKNRDVNIYDERQEYRGFPVSDWHYGLDDEQVQAAFTLCGMPYDRHLRSKGITLPYKENGRLQKSASRA